MVELYGIEWRRSYHQLSPIDAHGTWRETKKVEIDEEKFKELLQTMPGDDTLEHYNQSFRITKDGNSIRVSFFDYRKKSQYIRGKHQLEKHLTLDRYIIKEHSNNFYVSRTSFTKRKRSRSITQNFVRYENIEKMVNLLTSLLYQKFADYSFSSINDDTYEPIPLPVLQEIARIQKILINELDIADTIWESMGLSPFQQPQVSTQLCFYLTDFFTNAVLLWFCQKNHIKAREPWVYRLMAKQYVTKKELASHDNDYLAAVLHYYRLSDRAPEIIQARLHYFIKSQTSLASLSIWEKIFDNRFILNSNILNHPINCDEIFRLQHPAEQENFQGFLDYLVLNKNHIAEVVEANAALNEHGHYSVNFNLPISKLIIQIGRLYRMHILFDFSRLDEMIHDASFVSEEATETVFGFETNHTENAVDNMGVAITTLMKESEKFLITKFNPLYKKRVEKTFSMFGEKWQLKLHFKNAVTGANKLFELNAYLTNLTTKSTIEITVSNPNFKKAIQMSAHPGDLLNYIYIHINGKRRLYIDVLKLGIKDGEIVRLKGKALVHFFSSYSGVPMSYRHKRPVGDASFVHVLRKVYESFYLNTRYFSVDYQVLYPILDYHRKQNEILNKYTYIKT